MVLGVPCGVWKTHRLPSRLGLAILQAVLLPNTAAVHTGDPLPPLRPFSFCRVGLMDFGLYLPLNFGLRSSAELGAGRTAAQPIVSTHASQSPKCQPHVSHLSIRCQPPSRMSAAWA